MDELTKAVAAYLTHAWAHVTARISGVAGVGNHSAKVRPIPSAARVWFEECEDDPSWDGLIKTCAQIFSKEGHNASGERYREGLRNWFRRKGTYQTLLKGVHPVPANVAKEFAKDMRTEEDHLVELALLEGVSFERSEMHFGDFRILQPKGEDLEALLGIEANRLFYPEAVTSTERLPDHWCICCETREQRLKLGLMRVTWEMVGGPVVPTYTDFSHSLETALKQIILWDWERDYPGIPTGDLTSDTPWLPFSIPFIIVAQNSPFRTPLHAPPIGQLYYEPELNALGQEVGERPGCLYSFDDRETERFEMCIRQFAAQRKSVLELAEDRWEFMEVGLNYLNKAFFSQGVEQLLWHIVALEALLGEPGRGVTKRLSRRVAAIYSGDPARSESARKAFQGVYELRHALVHGRPFNAKVDSGHLRRARMLARRAATRMLDTLSGIAGEVRMGTLEHVPSREEVLGCLDLDLDSRERQAELLRAFPKLED